MVRILRRCQCGIIVMIETLEQLTGREPHPAIPLLPESVLVKFTLEEREKYFDARRELLLQERIDPMRYGVEPEIWALVDDCLCDGKIVKLIDHRGILPKDFAGNVEVIGARECMIGGSNRSSKSHYGAKKCLKIELTTDGARGWSFHESVGESLARQQPLFWYYMPPELRNEKTGRTKQGAITNIGYTQKNGFPDGTFVLPNKAQHWFKTYEQDPGKLEGESLDVAWLDENAPINFLKTIRFRLLDRKGLLIITFTPIDDGFTAIFNEYNQGASALLEVDAPLLPVKNKTGQATGRFEQVPRIKRAGPGGEGNVKANMIFFHITDNPFFDKETLYEQLRGANKEMILARAYGVATRAALNQFNFKETIHRIPHSRYLEIAGQNKAAPRFHLVDPCSGRNWFMLWIFCPWPGQKIVYREWPSWGEARNNPSAYIPGIGEPGPWAMPGSAADGERGPAQKPFKFGLERYKQEIERLEASASPAESLLATRSGEEIRQARNGAGTPPGLGVTVGETTNFAEQIFERWMDSRYGNAAKQEREGTTTLIEQMEEIGMSFIAMTGEKNILTANDGSIDMINAALAYDEKVPIGEFSPDLARINEPKFWVSENCPNLIYALQNWTGRDGQHGACKDPIDCLRGAYLSELDYIDDAMLRPRQPWLEAMGVR